MAVVPNSTVYLLRGCPLSIDKAHTMHFADRTTQTTYFSSLIFISGVRYSYIRDERALKVECNPAQAELCNYMMFRNTAYLNKWFYAFITKVDYVNDNTAKVYFEIDNIQTWFMDCELMPCFIEREHPATDEIGSNLIEDNLNYGEFIVRSFDNTFEEIGLGIVVVSTADVDGTPSLGAIYANVYSGLEFHVFKYANAANNFISNVVSKASEQAIVAVFMAPTEFFGNGQEPTIKQIEVNKNYSDIDGYIPKNKKLFTYPYNFIMISNNIGGLSEYRYEFFGNEIPSPNTKITFQLHGDQTCNPSVVISPLDYKNMGNNPNYMEKMTLTGWPQCTYVTDTFKSYLALNSTSDFVQSLAPWATMGTRTIMGGPVAAGFTAAHAVSNLMSLGAKYSAMVNMPPQAHGTSPGAAMECVRKLCFDIYQMTITAEFAKQIDDYWNVFGYPIRRVKVPEIKTRPFWNYVKTIGCKIKGNAPAPAMREIEQAFDNGITWWGRGDILGDYTLDNRPAEEGAI